MPAAQTTRNPTTTTMPAGPNTRNANDIALARDGKIYKSYQAAGDNRAKEANHRGPNNPEYLQVQAAAGDFYKAEAKERGKVDQKMGNDPGHAHWTQQQQKMGDAKNAAWEADLKARGVDPVQQKARLAKRLDDMIKADAAKNKK